MTTTTPVDHQQIAVLETALEGLRQLSLVWRHQAQPAIVADGDYTPESVDFIIRAWVPLHAAAEGGTVRYEGGPGRGDRLAIATILADVTWATDFALLYLRHWHAVQRIYQWQNRPLDFESQIRPLVLRRATLEQEPSPPFAYQSCCERIARFLGWAGYA